MVNQELVNYFQEGIRLGNPITVLETQLINAGFAENEVDEASEFVQKNKKVDSYEKKNYSLGVENLGEKKRPLGIIIVASLHWAIALSIVVSAVSSLFGQNSLGGGIFDLLFGFLSAALIFVAVVIAVLPLMVGIGIWKGINGWRIVAIIFGCIFTILGLFGLMHPTVLGIVNLLISGYVFGYLLFSKNGKSYFHKKN